MTKTPDEQNSTPLPPPGWYPDPAMAGTRRYWDGVTWTDHVAPAEQRPARGTSAWTIARGVALGIGVVIATLVFLGRCQAQQNRDDCVIENLDRAANGQPQLNCG